MSADVTDIVTVDPIEVEPSADAVTEPVKKTRGRRIKKNHTDAVIDPNNYSSLEDWLSEFYLQSHAQPARKGYDQHWNKNGFIHAGPALRLPNIGAANMIVFLADILADRVVNSGDEAISTEAAAILKVCGEWISKRVGERQAKKNAEILAKAEAIRKSQSAAE